MPDSLSGYPPDLSTHKARPSLKILLASGFTKRRSLFAKDDDKFLPKLTSDPLSKPYTRYTLAVVVRQALDEGP